MRYFLFIQLIWSVATLALNSSALQPPTGLVSRSGDRSVVLHWDRSPDPSINGYNVYRADSDAGPFVLLNTAGLALTPGYCDLGAANGRTNYYRLTSVTTGPRESLPSEVLAAGARSFAEDNQFLEYLQQVNFDYFWYLANPKNGLVPDRSAPGAACSIAAVGFGLSAIPIGIDHGWIQRRAGAARVLTTLKTFLETPQGPAKTGTIGYKGWFYHFLDMNSARRAFGELSSIDTVLLVAGMLDAKQYFDGPDPDEAGIRQAADTIFNRLDWKWMARGSNVVSMGWFPDSGFIGNNWIGYNEGMILYCLGLGAATNPLPSSGWTAWTSGYAWTTNYGQAFVNFPVLFGHQYSHCWIDFRHTSDLYMNAHKLTYFENSRRATLAQRAYCIANPRKHTGYGELVWGLTACDGPPGYAAHGAPPPQEDDGTIAPTAVAGSIAFTPEVSIPTLRHFYDQYRASLWTPYGFRDAFNLEAHWVGPDELGIDQGPIVIMIENYRTQRVWRRFMQNDVVQRGLQRAGFVPLESLAADRPPALPKGP
ncbi:MAG TPA: glucoamylase family protein [Verrucomicrobiae bacterium]|nr:glucoamylase family protein [Verrucomicrobiae bacterium]